MVKINYCSYWPLWLCFIVWMHCNCESYLSTYIREHHCKERLICKRLDFSWKFKFISWFEFKIRPFVRAQTRKAKEQFMETLIQ